MSSKKNRKSRSGSVNGSHGGSSNPNGSGGSSVNGHSKNEATEVKAEVVDSVQKQESSIVSFFKKHMIPFVVKFFTRDDLNRMLCGLLIVIVVTGLLKLFLPTDPIINTVLIIEFVLVVVAIVKDPEQSTWQWVIAVLVMLVYVLSLVWRIPEVVGLVSDNEIVRIYGEDGLQFFLENEKVYTVGNLNYYYSSPIYEYIWPTMSSIARFIHDLGQHSIGLMVGYLVLNHIFETLQAYTGNQTSKKLVEELLDDEAVATSAVQPEQVEAVETAQVIADHSQQIEAVAVKTETVPEQSSEEKLFEQIVDQKLLRSWRSATEGAKKAFLHKMKEANVDPIAFMEWVVDQNHSYPTHVEAIEAYNQAHSPSTQNGASEEVLPLRVTPNGFAADFRNSQLKRSLRWELYDLFQSVPGFQRDFGDFVNGIQAGTDLPVLDILERFKGFVIDYPPNGHAELQSYIDEYMYKIAELFGIEIGEEPGADEDNDVPSRPPEGFEGTTNFPVYPGSAVPGHYTDDFIDGDGRKVHKEIEVLPGGGTLGFMSILRDPNGGDEEEIFNEEDEDLFDFSETEEEEEEEEETSGESLEDAVMYIAKRIGWRWKRQPVTQSDKNAFVDFVLRNNKSGNAFDLFPDNDDETVIIQIAEWLHENKDLTFGKPFDIVSELKKAVVE